MNDATTIPKLSILKPPIIKKVPPQRLRSLGLDEAWLQDQIAQDPSLLGFGDIDLIQREKAQPTGGKIDLLMYDPDAGVRYEIEVMLGAVDESHIIRTIEYWDIERQRYPAIEHRAVIVAEQITSRFYNVIRLLNRSVPLIAIQFSAFRIGDEVILQFIRVLDTYEFNGEPEEEAPSEPVDRGYWEQKSNPDSLKLIEAVRTILPQPDNAHVAYNKYHVALGTTGYNFAWFHPRREASHCHIEIKVPPDDRQGIVDALQQNGVEANLRGRSNIVLRLRAADVEEHRDALKVALASAEAWSER